jgi:hypothetical protein
MSNSALFHTTSLGRIFLLGTIALSVFIWPVQAQMSARRLTQRIAPLLPPPANNAPRPAGAQPGAQPAARPAQPPPDPEQVEADRLEAARKAEDFRKRRAEEDSATAVNKAETSASRSRRAPLLIECKSVAPDSAQSLQSVSLTLSNTCPERITGMAMRLVYYGGKGEKLKEWTTRRELDQPLAGTSGMELNQPAYFMPWTTKRVHVEVKEVRFSNGTLWVQSSNPEG